MSSHELMVVRSRTGPYWRREAGHAEYAKILYVVIKYAKVLYVVAIPTPPKLAPTSCKMPDVKGLSNEFRTLRLGHQRSLETALQHLREFRLMIPAEYKSTHRSKRPLIGFIGMTTKSFFAVATEDGTKKLAAQIHKIDSGLHSAQDEIVKKTQKL